MRELWSKIKQLEYDCAKKQKEIEEKKRKERKEKEYEEISKRFGLTDKQKEDVKSGRISFEDIKKEKDLDNLLKEDDKTKEEDKSNSESNGIFSGLSSFFYGDSSEEKEEKKDDMLEELNKYIETSNTEVSVDSVSKLDQVIDDYKKLVMDHSMLEEKYNKEIQLGELKDIEYDESKKELEDQNIRLASIINKLEKNIRTTKAVCEKNIKLKSDECSKDKRKLNRENKELFDYVFNLYNSKINLCNRNITELGSRLNQNQLKKISLIQKGDVKKSKTLKKKKKKKSKNN